MDEKNRAVAYPSRSIGQMMKLVKYVWSLSFVKVDTNQKAVCVTQSRMGTKA